MAAGDEHAASEVLRGVARHLNCLNEDNKATRRRALELIRRDTLDRALSSGVQQEVFSALLQPLLRCLSDPMEKCRETSIAMITEFLRSVPRPEEALPYLMPCLAQRFGEKEVLEPAEELRLSAVEMLVLLVEVCGKNLAPFLSEMIRVLQRSILDPFPDVKRESCRCAVEFAKSVPEHFHLQAESLVNPLMLTVSHQHSRVRVSVIEATGAVIQHGSGKNMDDVLSHLAQRLFDDSPQVRKAVTAVVGDWLLHMRDRYSYFHRLIPLLLSSINDEIPEIRLLAADLWRQVGSQWEKENEDDIKDKMDFLLTPPPHYPPGVERPGLGCRELVVRNLGRLVPAVSHDVTDWLVPTRIRTSQLLSVLLLHAEDHSTQHLQPLLATIYRACSESERDVVRNVVYLERLSSCVEMLLHQCESDCGSISLQLLQVLVTVQSLSTDSQLSEKALETVQLLCKVQGLDSVIELYRQHMDQLLDWLSSSVSTWSSFSPQRLQLQVVVVQSGPVIGEFLSQLMPLLCSCLQPNRDPEMRMSIFTMFAKLLLDANNTLDSRGRFCDESEQFLCDVLLPNLVWRAGRTAAAVRTAVLSCVLALLHGQAITPGQLLSLEEKLSPRVLSALDEDSQMSRLFACRSLSAILRLIGTSLHQEALNKIYPELLKRLDDSSEEVRGEALQALDLWLSSLTKDYDLELCSPHLQLLFQQLLLHLDDPDSSVQDRVLDVLKKGSSVHPVLLRREVEAVRDKHRSPVYCDLLLQSFSSPPTS
uniref:TOG domain-containing protein n=1 Tax=Amphiprion ocellaris TaxID=80972 RepID=A0AAQ6A8Y3_AMPOC